MKLLYGTYQHIKPEFAVYNFSGLIEAYPHIHLIPQGLNPEVISNFEEKEFDYWYANQMMTNMFGNLMNFIRTLQEVEVLYLIIGDDGWSYTLIESFLKFLQVRYGITGTLIENDEDIQYANETDFNPYWGISAYDMDYLTYQEFLERGRAMQGGTAYVE